MSNYTRHPPKAGVQSYVLDSRFRRNDAREYWSLNSLVLY